MTRNLHHGDSLYQVIDKVNDIINGTVVPASIHTQGGGSNAALINEINRAMRAESALQEQIDSVAVGSGDIYDAIILSTNVTATNIKYTVKNCICMLSVSDIMSTVTTAPITVCNVPKAKCDVTQAIVDIAGNNIAVASIAANSDELNVTFNTANVPGSISIMYFVADDWEE